MTVNNINDINRSIKAICICFVPLTTRPKRVKERRGNNVVYEDANPEDEDYYTLCKAPNGKWGLNDEEWNTGVAGKDRFTWASKADDWNGYGFALKKGIVCIDADSKESVDIIDKILLCENISTFVTDSDNGKHYFFRLPESWETEGKNRTKKVQLSCGLMNVDILYGRNQYIIHKMQGRKRNIINAPKDGIIPELPPFFYPLRGVGQSDEYGHLVGLDVNQSRFTTLSRFVPAILIAVKSFDSVREVVRIINNYVFKTPLSLDKIDQCTNDTMLSNIRIKGISLDDKSKSIKSNVKETESKKKNSIAEIAQEIIDEYNVTSDRQLKKSILTYFIDDVPMTNEAEITAIVGTKLCERQEYSPYKVDAILTFMKQLAPKTVCNPYIIRIGSRFFDVFNRRWIESECNNIVPVFSIKDEYNPNAYCQELEDLWKDRFRNEDYKREAYIIFTASCLLPYNQSNTRNLFICSGSGHGKSTLARIIYSTIGRDDNTSFVDFKNMGKGSFELSNMKNKAINYIDEISSFIENDEITNYNSISMGSPILDKIKGIQTAGNFIPRCKMIICGTEDPCVSDIHINSWARRNVRLEINSGPFEANSKFNMFTTSMIETDYGKPAREYLLKLAVDYLIANPIAFKGENDPLLRFIHEDENIKRGRRKSRNDITINSQLSDFLTRTDINGMTFKDIINKYHNYCNYYGLIPFSSKIISSYLKHNGWVTKQPNNVRIYVFKND